MPLRYARHALLVLCTLVLLVTPSAIYSCGPFLETAVFAFRDQPDGSAENFAAGILGIVRPGFRTSYLVIAYRYLTGLKLNAPQQKAAIAVWNRDAIPDHPSEDDSISAWNKARNQIPGMPAATNISAYAPVSPEEPYFSYLNCPGEAFQNAAKTLGERSSKLGLQSAVIHEWVTAQDQVFRNCAGDARVIPAGLTSGDTAQRADRAYQIASANFYTRNFDDAVRDFDAIAKDPSSPWAQISPYLAARALVRKSTLSSKDSNQFDRESMAAAQQRLEQIVNDPKANAYHAAAVKLLNYVRFRTEPAKRVGELEQIMLSPDPGPDFKQNLWDYVLLLSHGEQAGALSDWVKSFQSLAPNTANGSQQSEVTQRALDTWHKTRSLPWLIAALQGIDPSSAQLTSLLADARSIPPTSAGYLTAQYRSLAMMAVSGQQDSARNELDHLLAKIQSETPADSSTPLGSYNLLNDVRLTLTTSLDDLLAHAAERAVGADEGPGADEQIDNPGGIKKDDKFLTPYSAKIFQKRLPLALLAEAAQSSTLQKPLRRDLARSTWVRAVLLNDLATAAKLQPTIHDLDPPLWKAMEPFRTAPNDAAKRFAGILIILQNPGLKPFAREGYLRTETLGVIDSYRDNWWCPLNEANWGGTSGMDAFGKPLPDPDAETSSLTWLAESQKSAASLEWKKLAALGTAPDYLAAQVLDRARQDPRDPFIPQALHLAVRATRFGCTGKETSALSKEAFDYLHTHYPESEWATQTKYYY